MKGSFQGSCGDGQKVGRKIRLSQEALKVGSKVV